MTALDRNDRIPDDAPQNKVKLEWITPKISLMEGGDTDGKGKPIKPIRMEFEDYGNTGPS